MTNRKHLRDTPRKLTPQIVRPYGDTTGDGMIQVSFTLPLPHDKRAEGAALQLAKKMGMDPALVVHAKPIGPDFTFFVVYGSSNHLVDLGQVHVQEREFPLLSPKEVSLAIKRGLRRRLVALFDPDRVYDFVKKQVEMIGMFFQKERHEAVGIHLVGVFDGFGAFGIAFVEHNDFGAIRLALVDVAFHFFYRNVELESRF